MGKNCCYGPCTVSTYNNPEVRWCPFVKPWWSIERCEEWKALCDREDLLVSFDTWICERHFPPGADLNPKKNLDLKPFKAPPGSRRERRTKPNPVNYGDEFHLNLEEFHKNAPKRSYHKSFGNDADSFVNCEIVKKEPLTEEETAKNTENSIIVIKKEDLTDKTTYLKTKIRILEAQLETERKYKDPLSDLSLLLSKVETLEMKLAEEKKKSDQLTSQNASLKVENAKLKQLKEPKGGIVKSVLEKHFSEAQIQCILHNDFDLSVSWSKLDLINAAQIFAYSKDAYEHLKQKRMIPLPDTNEVEGFLKYGSFRNKIQGIQHFNLILDLQPKKKKPPSTQIKEEQCQLEIDAYSKRDYEIDFKI